MKLTESQARRAINKWLFEKFQPDPGHYSKYSTDDKVAGSLGDNRNKEMELNTPVPIIASPQMPTQLSWDMPPVDDPEWAPSSAQDAARAAHQITSTIPDEQAQWYYEEMMKLRDKALEKSKPEIVKSSPSKDNIKNQIQPKRAKSEGSDMSESLKKRWINKLLEGLDEEEDEGKLSTSLLDDFASEFAEEEGMDIEDVYRGNEVLKNRQDQARKERKEQNQDKNLNAFDLSVDDEATLKQIQNSGVLPNIATLSGIRKYIANNIDPHVEIWVTANHLSRLMSSFIASSKGLYLFFDAVAVCTTGEDALFTPEQALELKGMSDLARALEDTMRKNRQRVGVKFRQQLASDPAFVKQLVSQFGNEIVFEEFDEEFPSQITVNDLYQEYESLKKNNRAVLTESGLYREIMSKIIVEPIIRKWNQWRKEGKIIKDRNIQNQLSYDEAADWIDEAIELWENKSNGRKKGAVREALLGLMEFRDAQETQNSITKDV